MPWGRAFLALGQSLLGDLGLKVLGALAVIIVGRMVAGSLRKAMDRLIKRTETDVTLGKFLSSLVYYLVHIVVPNSSIYGGTIHNYSHHPIRRIDLVMGISYDDDIGLAIKAIQQVLDEEPRVLKDPAYQVAVSELADSSVNLVVRPWCAGEDYWALRFDLTRALKERLEAAGCSIPYPQQAVHMHSVE